jgi:Fe-S oxidoreductase
MSYNPFVLPFTIGLLLLLVMLCFKYLKWLYAFSEEDRRKVTRTLFSLKLGKIIWEIFTESLLHRKIFRANTMLGFMHMIFALGWFLLIIVGTLESKFQSNFHFNPPWDPIFFQYFTRKAGGFPHSETFAFAMDFILAVILAGVAMAWVKRLYSRLFGMRKTTKHHIEDRVALTFLWLIFPLRFVAESITSALCGNGGFLTVSAGHLLAGLLPTSTLQAVELPIWWAYSLSLFFFFVALPFTRYLHIPTEVLLIVLRKSGIQSSNRYNTFHKVEASSCPRCGICINKCQINSATEKEDQLPIYFLRHVRNGSVCESKTFSCMQCGRCKQACPVGIDTIAIRNGQQNKFFGHLPASFSYIPPTEIKETKILYFGGCMTNLTPTIKIAMKKILDTTGISYEFMDKDGSICCGKPMMVSGNYDAAKELMNKNIEIIINSKAKTLVTSCPICYHIFKNEYDLDIRVLHHTEFIAELIYHNIIGLKDTDITYTYHDPCELGRLSSIYEAPRLTLQQAGNFVELKNNREDSLCCGGSVGNLNLTMQERDRITRNALIEQVDSSADVLVTSCPLCKKTFAKHSDIRVQDIAEVVAVAMEKVPKSKVQERIVLESSAINI